MTHARALLLSFAMGLALVGCRQPETPPSPPPVDTQAALHAEREALFGAEALAGDVKWQGELGYKIVAPGAGPKPALGQIVRLTYVGRLKDGTVFDRANAPAEFSIGRTIVGLSTGLQMLSAGGKAVFFIPPAQGYGARKVMGIPPHSGLIFEVEVLAVNP